LRLTSSTWSVSTTSPLLTGLVPVRLAEVDRRRAALYAGGLDQDTDRPLRRRLDIRPDVSNALVVRQIALDDRAPPTERDDRVVRRAILDVPLQQDDVGASLSEGEGAGAAYAPLTARAGHAGRARKREETQRGRVGSRSERGRGRQGLCRVRGRRERGRGRRGRCHGCSGSQKADERGGEGAQGDAVVSFTADQKPSLEARGTVERRRRRGRGAQLAARLDPLAYVSPSHRLRLCLRTSRLGGMASSAPSTLAREHKRCYACGREPAASEAQLLKWCVDIPCG